MYALIIEDEKLVGYALSRHLEKRDVKTNIINNGREGVKVALEDPPDVLFVDYRLPDITGLQVLHELQSIREETIFFFMTAYGTDEVSVEALNMGAYEYLNKPLNLSEVSLLVNRALKNKTLNQERNFLQQKERSYQVGSFISYSEKMKKVIETVKKLVPVENGTILLTGETGTGKDTLARLIHENSPRADKQFVVTNCASLPGTLLESELFGYEKGAFTDAKERKRGQLEIADGGTLYLDEIGEIPIEFQAKFLRFVETQSFYRVGGTRELKVNVRIIASTNRDLHKEMITGNFREDLFFRLNVIALTLPPLRHRKEDLPHLVNILINKLKKELQTPTDSISDSALKMVVKYDWPGNIRELKNTLERIFLLERPSVIESWHFPLEMDKNPSKGPRTGNSTSDHLTSFFQGKTLDEIERLMLSWALKQENGNQTHTAKRLGITRDQVRYQIKKFKIDTHFEKQGGLQQNK